MGSNHREARVTSLLQSKHCRKITDIFGICVRVESKDKTRHAATQTKHFELFFLCAKVYLQWWCRTFFSPSSHLCHSLHSLTKDTSLTLPHITEDQQWQRVVGEEVVFVWSSLKFTMVFLILNFIHLPSCGPMSVPYWGVQITDIHTFPATSLKHVY